MPIMKKFANVTSKEKHINLLWASTRELLNIVQANEVGCDIITVPENLLSKISQLGKSLDLISLETVKMFRRDALESNFNIPNVNQI
jgi:transaldolase